MTRRLMLLLAGLALLAAYPSARAAIGAALFVLLSIVIWPSWVGDWLSGLHTATHIAAPITRPGRLTVQL